MREIKNAKIKSTMLGIEDHGIFTFTLHLDYGGSGQGFGQCCLDEPLKKDGTFIKRIGTACGMDLIMKVLQIVGANSWEELPGKVIRADASYDQVYRIGNFLEDKWLDLAEHFKSWGVK